MKNLEEKIKGKKMHLKLKLWCDENPDGTAIVFMQVLEQKGLDWYQDEGYIRVIDSPELTNSCLYLRGEDTKDDMSIVSLHFPNASDAKGYVKTVVGWLDSALIEQPQAPKRGDFVEVTDIESGRWGKRIFLADLGEGINMRYVCVNGFHTERFIQKCGGVDSMRWKHMRPVKRTGYNPETGMYEVFIQADLPYRRIEEHRKK
jgi:hypothetical protein